MHNKETVTQNKYFGLVGIIPVAQYGKLFDFPWHDSLMPIGENYLATERSVVECAHAGCDSIWIICYNDMQQLLRERIGEWIFDPRFFGRNLFYKKRIPIYYVPIHPKDRGRRDCLGFSIAYGIWFSNQIHEKISKYTTPDAFYISFPYGLIDRKFVQSQRVLIKKRNKRFLFEHDNKTVFDGEYLSFTLYLEDIVPMMNNLRKGKQKHYFDENGKIKRYKKSEEYSAKNFTLKDVFKNMETKNSNIVKVPWYYNIDSWDKYCNFLKEKNDLTKPKFMTYEEF